MLRSPSDSVLSPGRIDSDSGVGGASESSSPRLRRPQRLSTSSGGGRRTTHRVVVFAAVLLAVVCVAAFFGQDVLLGRRSSSLLFPSSRGIATVSTTAVPPTRKKGGEAYEGALRVAWINVDVNQTKQLEEFRAGQAKALDKFVRQQTELRELIREELSVATASLSAVALKRGSSTGTDSAGRTGNQQHNEPQPHDTWAFMIPVIHSNPRRQNRLVTNICNLVWPPKVLIGIGFLVDSKSRPLVEDSIPILTNCGVPRHAIALYDDPPQE